MSSTSIYPTYPRTNLWNFQEKILRIGGEKKLSFFCVSHFESFFFCFIIQISHNLCDTKDGSKFWWSPWFSAQNSLFQLVCTPLYISTCQLSQKQRENYWRSYASLSFEITFNEYISLFFATLSCTIQFSWIKYVCEFCLCEIP